MRSQTNNTPSSLASMQICLKVACNFFEIKYISADKRIESSYVVIRLLLVSTRYCEESDGRYGKYHWDRRKLKDVTKPFSPGLVTGTEQVLYRMMIFDGNRN